MLQIYLYVLYEFQDYFYQEGYGSVFEDHQPSSQNSEWYENYQILGGMKKMLFGFWIRSKLQNA